MTLNTFIKKMPQFTSINTAHIHDDLAALLKSNSDAIDQLLTQHEFTWANLMAPIEELDDKLSKFWSPIGHLNGVLNTDDLRDAYESCLPLLSDYGTKLAHNKKYYNAIQSIADSAEYKNLDDAQKKIITNSLRDFKLSGVSLPDDQKKRFADISKTLSELQNTFENHILDATKAWTKHVTDVSLLAGIPQMMQDQFAQTAKARGLAGWLITLDMPSYFAVVTYADSRELRRELYEAYVTRASDQGPNAKQFDNTQVMQDILINRLELAKLIGFTNYAEKSLATKMVRDTQEVLNFLNQLVDASLPKARDEFAKLKQFAKESLGLTDFHAWDVAFASEKLRQQKYDISQEELRPYFPEQQVLSGLFTIIDKLFGINVEPLLGVDLWHPDARAYALYDKHKNVIAAVYTDLYARADKRGGAWMDEQVRRRLPSGEIQLPIAYVTCNFNGPVGNTPALLQHDDVVTLFHEFGHALQHMLTQVDYADVSGINGIPWDAVEVASQFLENWTWQRECMPLISKHYQTGQALPDDLFDKMNRAKNFQSAMMMMRQLEFSLFDFELHVLFDPAQKDQIQHVLNRVRERVTVVPVAACNRFQHSFAHIFAGGYGAGYYSYKWAEVMASDAFDLFLEQGLFDQATSERFKKTFMERGGVEEPADLFEQFRGRAPRVEALLKQTGIIE